MTHWAAAYIGLGYEATGRCWGLVRRVFAEQLGIDMPHVGVGEEGNEPALLQAARVSGWRPVRSVPREFDILLARLCGERHVGLMVRANGGMYVLHALASDGVVLQPLADLALLGYRDFELWRRAAC